MDNKMRKKRYQHDIRMYLNQCQKSNEAKHQLLTFSEGNSDHDRAFYRTFEHRSRAVESWHRERSNQSHLTASKNSTNRRFYSQPSNNSQIKQTYKTSALWNASMKIKTYSTCKSMHSHILTVQPTERPKTHNSSPYLKKSHHKLQKSQRTPKHSSLISSSFSHPQNQVKEYGLKKISPSIMKGKRLKKRERGLDLRQHIPTNVRIYEPSENSKIRGDLNRIIDLIQKEQKINL